MSEQKKPLRKRTRVTMEKLTEIRRLFGEGISIIEIARSTGLHRHTVRTYIKEKFEDVVADEARKQSLVKGLELHFQDIAKFAQNNLKAQLNASVPQPEEISNRYAGSISINGMMGLPARGTPQYMAEEWLRMYYPSPRDSHLMKSLRIHTKESAFWIHWDKFRKIVSAYEVSSKKLWEWLEEQLSNVPPENYSPWDPASFRKIVFGNILRASSSNEVEEPDLTIKSSPGSDGIIPIVKTKDSPLSIYTKELLDQTRKRPDWASLKAATKELMGSDNQHELKRLAREIDKALVVIELMHAFPGHCEVCPV